MEIQNAIRIRNNFSLVGHFLINPLHICLPQNDFSFDIFIQFVIIQYHGIESIAFQQKETTQSMRYDIRRKNSERVM